jgi:membrane protease YdiL (CAAX protease family)
VASPFTSPPPARPEAVVVPGAPAPEPPPWPGWLGPVALLAALIATSVLGVVAVAIIGSAGANVDHPDKGGVAIALTYLQDATFIGTVLVLARFGGHKLRAADLGIRPPKVGATVRWVGVAVVGYTAFAIVFTALVKPGHDDNLFRSLGIHRNAAGSVAALAVLVCVLAPIAEEMLFRGFMFQAMRQWGGPWVAAVLVGLLFGGIHAFGGTPAILLVQLAVLGFLFALVRWKTDSILPTIGLHAINNALAFASLEGWGWQAVPLLIGAVALALAAVTPFARPDWRARRSLA